MENIAVSHKQTKLVANSAARSEPRIPSLDGARAISITFVIVAHLAASGTLLVAQRLWRFDLGNLGVRVFFLISGFLITSLLIEEASKTGTISLRNFYLRRVFRIVPAYWTYLAVVSILIPLQLANSTYPDVASALLYLSNYLIPGFAVGHSWSLSVEEQFYLVWPITVLTLGARRSLPIAAAFLLISPIFRFLCDLGLWRTQPRYAFETVADAIATGCLLAGYRDALWASKQYRALLSSRVFLALPFTVIAIAAYASETRLWNVLGISALNIILMLTLDRYMRFPNSVGGKLLNSSVLKFIGVLSYSLYLWQQIFLDPRHSLIFPINLACIVVCATGSYFLVERPALAYGKRFRTRIASNTKPESP